MYWPDLVRDCPEQQHEVKAQNMPLTSEQTTASHVNTKRRVPIVECTWYSFSELVNTPSNVTKSAVAVILAKSVKVVET